MTVDNRGFHIVLSLLVERWRQYGRFRLKFGCIGLICLKEQL